MLPLLDLPPDAVRPPDSQCVTGNRHSRPAHGCLVCGKRWGGSKTCHCSVCHELFSTVSNFDRHRPSRDGCLTPADAGLVRSTRSPGVWCRPGVGE